MSKEFTPDRLADLLVDPREDLDVEFKNWLDLQANNRDKATLAKAALALANHGGGVIVLGFTETEGALGEAASRPATLDRYSQDVVNGIVQKYCDPPFHCAVHMVPSGDGRHFPIVRIPGGHPAPVRAKRAGPDGDILEENAIYVRKSGPRSQRPESAQEWNDLLSRCLLNRRDELFDQMRHLLYGAVPPAEPASDDERLDRWVSECFDRWRSLVESLSEDAGPRFPSGHYSFAYEISGNARPVTLAQLPEILRASETHYSGWPPFWYPTREGIEPYARAGGVECWLGDDPRVPTDRRDPAHSDFWRVTPDGRAFLLRGYDEDVRESMYRATSPFPPGTTLDLGLPIWHAGETLLHAERLASRLCEGSATIRFAAEFTGLQGRSLGNLFGRPHVHSGASRQESIHLRVHVDARTIGSNLPEIVHPLLRPLYELFGFFDLPMQLVVDELKQLRDRNS